MNKNCPKCNKKMWIGKTIVDKYNWYCKDYPYCNTKISCKKIGVI